MADVITIPENIFYIIIAIIAVVGIIVALMQWRRVREAQSNIQFLERQAELRKIELIEKDLESKRMMENVIPLPKEQQERLSEIRKNTSDLMHKAGYLHSEINEDRKSTRLNSSHVKSSYAVFCLKKKKVIQHVGDSL